MKTDISLGRILGIKVSFNWSVLIIAAVYVYFLAEHEFPNQAPGMSNAAYWTAGIFGALLFFGCLLAHELGHSLVARRAGIEVRGIKLWLLGGFAELTSEPDTAGRQFAIAAAGPVTNVVLAVAFWALHFGLAGSNSLYAATPGIAGLAGAVAGWLAFINLLLAAFNLLPAAPLDGGHLLSAGLWAATGNQTTARLWAGRAGVALGGVMLFFGVSMFLGDNSFNGFFFLLVGWWIMSAARQDIGAAGIERVFDDVNLGQIMRPDPPVLPGWTTIDHALSRLPMMTPDDAFPVQGEDGRIIGLLSSSQITQTDAVSRAQLPISQLAFPLDRITWAGTTEPALPALRRLAGTGVPTMLVVWPNGRIAGTVGQREFAQAVARRGQSKPLAFRR